jgi:hypothetical protein
MAKYSHTSTLLYFSAIWKLLADEARAFWYTRHTGKAGGAGGLAPPAAPGGR